MATVNYVVALYGGKRRHYHLTPILDFAKKQVEFLKQKPKHITQVSFVFNESDNPEDQAAIEYLSNINLPIPHSIRIRENTGFSYGAWNAVINSTKNDFDYTFLIEDDYIPTKTDFIDYFLSKIKDDTIYVCCLYRSDHAALASGLFINKHAFTPAFKLIDNNSYSYGAYENQIHFLRLYQNEGFKIEDITDIAHTEFLNVTRQSILYGDQSKPFIMGPIMV